MDHIYFYGRTKGRVNGKYRFLSNFYVAPIMLDGKQYRTIEHYFQSQKFPGEDLGEAIRLADTARAAKKLAWQRPAPADWDERKESVMLAALRTKFAQYPELAQKLLATGDAQLHEDSPDDLFWGVKGRDRLGQLLMKVREELRG